MAAARSSVAALELNVSSLSSSVSTLQARLSSLSFNYTPPPSNVLSPAGSAWDPNQVKGLVATLLTLKNPDVCTPECCFARNTLKLILLAQAALALEICAGGRLFNVVIDTDLTGTLLLRYGQLTRRVTLIPLNKIQPRLFSASTVQYAKSLVPTSAPGFSASSASEEETRIETKATYAAEEQSGRRRRGSQAGNAAKASKAQDDRRASSAAGGPAVHVGVQVAMDLILYHPEVQSVSRIVPSFVHCCLYGFSILRFPRQWNMCLALPSFVPCLL